MSQTDENGHGMVRLIVPTCMLALGYFNIAELTTLMQY
jgi:hypothetical protein